MSRLYGDIHRAMQMAFDTRSLADRIEAIAVKPEIDEGAKAFIESRDMFFLTTIDHGGRPTVSYKGGVPGFVRVLDQSTLVFPSYDGNGMYRTWGNVLVNAHVGLLFVDFERPKRLRVNGTAQISPDDPMRSEWPDSVFIVRIKAERIFPNCPRYIHKMQLVEHSAYAPRPDYTPPVPAWKTFAEFRDSLPARDRTEEP